MVSGRRPVRKELLLGPQSATWVKALVSTRLRAARLSRWGVTIGGELKWPLSPRAPMFGLTSLSGAEGSIRADTHLKSSAISNNTFLGGDEAVMRWRARARQVIITAGKPGMFLIN